MFRTDCFVLNSKGGRKRIDCRGVRTGILSILRTGIPWHELPLELGCVVVVR